MTSSRFSSHRIPIAAVALLLALLPLYRTPTVVSAENQALAEFQRLWPITSNNTNGASVAVDNSGGVHLAFSAYTAANGTYPVYYAYCAANCAVLANWTVAAVENIGVYGGSVRLEVTETGLPRMVWYSQLSLSEDGIYQYAQCDGGCTHPDQWSIVDLHSDPVGPSNTRYFALDNLGNPRYVYTDTDVVNDHEGTFYAFCNGDCASAGSWDEAQIFTAYLRYEFSLAFSPSGAARLAYRAAGMDDSLGYAECDEDCESADNWHSVTVIEQLGGSGAALSLDLDSNDLPRLAVYSGYYDSSSQGNDLLWYGWCNADCLRGDQWTFDLVGLPKNYGKDVELRVDTLNRLHLAYYVEDLSQSIYGLGYTVCTSDCTSAAPNWEDTFVETDTTLDTSDPITPTAGCDEAYWLDVGKDPSLAVDVVGQPRIGFTAVNYQGGKCTLHENIRLVRYGQSGISISPVDLHEKIFLPLTVRK